MNVSCKLTVYFEKPFWVGVYECNTEGALTAAKIVFGSEPKDYMIYDLLLKDWHKLQFSHAVMDKPSTVKKINPKRMQKQISQHTSEEGIGTKAQQALKLQHEQHKIEGRLLNHEKIEAEKERKFELKQQKRKKKHKGR